MLLTLDKKFQNLRDPLCVFQMFEPSTFGKIADPSISIS